MPETSTEFASQYTILFSSANLNAGPVISVALLVMIRTCELRKIQGPKYQSCSLIWLQLLGL